MAVMTPGPMPIEMRATHLECMPCHAMPCMALCCKGKSATTLHCSSVVLGGAADSHTMPVCGLQGGIPGRAAGQDEVPDSGELSIHVHPERPRIASNTGPRVAH